MQIFPDSKNAWAKDGLYLKPARIDFLENNIVEATIYCCQVYMSYDHGFDKIELKLRNYKQCSFLQK